MKNNNVIDLNKYKQDKQLALFKVQKYKYNPLHLSWYGILFYEDQVKRVMKEFNKYEYHKK